MVHEHPGSIGSEPAFVLVHRNPVLPVSTSITPDRANRSVLALDIQNKFRFVDAAGQVVHEYGLPGSPEIHNCGGYVEKIAKYRDPALADHFRKHGVSKASFASFPSPLLSTRSPQLDLLIFELIRDLRRRSGGCRVTLFDHGCSAAEHFDLLDVMLQAAGEGRGRDLLNYVGLDISPMLLTAAKMFHTDVDPQHFRFVLAEGSALDFPDRAFDLSLTVGVVNHVVHPPSTLTNLLRGTRYAAVMALWVTLEEEGFHALNHSGNSNYFFSRRDLAALQEANPDGRFLVADFIPEQASSQRSSYINVDAARERMLGCYHLVFTRLERLPFDFEELAF